MKVAYAFAFMQNQLYTSQMQKKKKKVYFIAMMKFIFYKSPLIFLLHDICYMFALCN